tara:strand:+ start:231 stop:407 length:177 start_codon:yes stop_codon:yes gene_type:complete
VVVAVVEAQAVREHQAKVMQAGDLLTKTPVVAVGVRVLLVVLVVARPEVTEVLVVAVH